MNTRLRRAALVGGVVLVGTALMASLIGSAAGASARRHGPQRASQEKSWSFGVMADTQWTVADDGKNPNTVAVDVINRVNSQFIKNHVKFVIQVGDLVDKQAISSTDTTTSLDTTAVFRQALYKAGIGFYPLRGNHEGSQASANEFLKVFPQTQNATMNSTPASAFAAPNPDASTQPFPTPAGSPFQVGAISASPAAPAGFGGLCYAFDYGNARFIMLDQFTPTTGTSHSALDATQVDWMNQQLSSRPAGTHAFVFGHKGIITENHPDTLFGDDPSVNPTPPAQGIENALIGDLQANGVRYYIGGHDHMHNRALVRSADGTSSVEDIIAQSDSSKFYIPYGTKGYDTRAVDPQTKAVTETTTPLPTADPTQTNDYIYDVLVAGGATRETPISQESAPEGAPATGVVHIGYYIFHVCGPRVTVDYYSAPVTAANEDGEYLISSASGLRFNKVESFGYSLNGKEFQVAEGQSYTGVSDSFAGTQAQILGGTNHSTATDTAGRALTETVDTGWTQVNDGGRLQSNALTLWGLVDLGRTHSSTYALSMSYQSGNGHGASPLPRLLTYRLGHWVNAVVANVGGHPRHVIGPWKPGYKLGTWGVDPGKHTVWAVIDRQGTFAAGQR